MVIGSCYRRRTQTLTDYVVETWPILRTVPNYGTKAENSNILFTFTLRLKSLQEKLILLGKDEGTAKFVVVAVGSNDLTVFTSASSVTI